MSPTPRIFSLIVAAGVGSRAGGELPKQYARIGGKALLRYSVEALLAHPRITGVQVVIHPEHLEYYAQAVGTSSGGKPSPLRGEGLDEGGSTLGTHSPRTLTQPSPLKGEGSPASPLSRKLLPPIHGGAERTDSVRAGLDALVPHAPDYVLIHDAARPFLSHATIDALIHQLTPHQAVVPALPVADTVRRFEGEKWHEVNRDGLMRIQTPQVFPFAPLRNLLLGKTAIATDEAAVWLAANLPLGYIPGDEDLRKITTADDMLWAQQKHASTRRTAIGMGFDVHALMPSGDKGVIRLGGIDIEHGHKLHGHSDADVVLHAIVDALLGTIGAGDIGLHFPPSDARWKGADSTIFIEEARAQVVSHGGIIEHLDLTIIGEQPKISPHREAMRASIAQLLKLPVSHVSVKATTTEKLGFTGREEGIACQAVATVSLPVEAA